MNKFRYFQHFEMKEEFVYFVSLVVPFISHFKSLAKMALFNF